MVQDSVLDPGTITEAPADATALASSLRRHNPVLVDVIEAVPSPLLLLDDTLRIVMVNPAAQQVLRAGDRLPPAGLRPGEALGCVRARMGPGICTVDPDCSGCGLYRALHAARSDGEARGEWQVTISLDDVEETAAYALRVRRLDGALPVTLWLAGLQDIGEEQRKEALQRIFFHDLLNVTGGIQGLTQLLPELTAAERDESLGLLERLAVQLTETIGGQRDLLWAERGQLTASPQPLDLGLWLEDLAALYARHPVADGRTIACNAPPRGVRVVTDGSILARVVGNLVKNALEASSAGETVTVRAFVADERCFISVHNSAVMPPDVKRQVFQRSFSTKSRTRGLGSYSARLLTRSCLHGTVSVTSDPGTGTLFTVDIPAQA